MNPLIIRLSGGSLASDGDANGVADEILQHPDLIAELLEGLGNPDEVVRGHTAHALERIARVQPELLIGSLTLLIYSAHSDPVPTVKWHIAMLCANLSALGCNIDQLISLLFDLLQDDSVFVKSWSISSLCIIGRRFPKQIPQILPVLHPLQNYQGKAIRTRAKKAVECLENPSLPIPAGWVKK